MNTKNIFSIITIIYVALNSGASFGAPSGCQCLCSIFFTRGGETKLCPEESTNKTQCANWYFEITQATSKKDCFTQGEDPKDCKGYFKEKSLKGSWTLSEGGRLHSCKFF